MHKFEGRISSSGFSSGDIIVIGDWEKSPLGAFTNIMWMKPNGKRILLSPSNEHADYVSSLYQFEEVIILPIEVKRERFRIEISAGSLDVSMKWKKGWRIPKYRPLWFISTIEQFAARIFFGTRTYGRTNNGLREWYCIHELSKIVDSVASDNGKQFGQKTAIQTKTCFGFTNPPKKPTSVKLRSVIENLDSEH